MSDYSRRVVVPLRDLVFALEGAAANADTDPRWRAATELRRLDGWEGRTIAIRVVGQSVPLPAREFSEEGQP